MSVSELREARAAGSENEVLSAPKGGQPFGDDGFTFRDFLDIINPLQHIPLVSTIYRRLTGDTIDSGAKMVGDCLFGGPLGYLGYVVGTAISDTTGKEPGEHFLALFVDDAKPSPADVQLAEANARFTTAAGKVGPDEMMTDAEPFDSDERAEFGLLFANARLESDRLAAERSVEPPRPSAASGAVASEGGWFTDVMLSALERYQTAAQLTAAGGGMPRPAGAGVGGQIDVSY